MYILLSSLLILQKILFKGTVDVISGDLFSNLACAIHNGFFYLIYNLTWVLLWIGHTNLNMKGTLRDEYIPFN